MSKTQQESIGTIVAFWKNPLGTLVCAKSGTAFAITKNIILTCTHNIYSERRSEFCSFVLFYPNPDRSVYDLNALQSYASQPGQFYQCLEVTQTLRTKPIKQEICLVALKKDLPIINPIRLGTISSTNHTIGNQLTISGYPSAYCRMKNDLTKVRADRVTLSGKILAFEGDIINYQIQTSIGHSGSPLLYKDQEGSYMAIGIHTHRGLRPDYNSGLFFSIETLRMIQSFCSSLSQRYGLSTKINYACDKQKLKNYQKKVECVHNTQNTDTNDLQFELTSNSESSYSNESSLAI